MDAFSRRSLFLKALPAHIISLKFWLKYCKSLPTISRTQVEGVNVQIYKDKYVLHLDFHAIDMDDVDIIFGYPWMDSTSTININVQKKFLKLWYQK